MPDHESTPDEADDRNKPGRSRREVGRVKRPAGSQRVKQLCFSRAWVLPSSSAAVWQLRIEVESVWLVWKVDDEGSEG